MTRRLGRCRTGRGGNTQWSWVVDSTLSRLSVKPLPLTWLQHCMPASVEVQANSEFLAEEPYPRLTPLAEKVEPHSVDWPPLAPILTIRGLSRQELSACLLMTQVAPSFPRVQVMLPLGASKADSSWAPLGAGALSVGVAEALGVADAVGEAEALFGAAPAA